MILHSIGYAILAFMGTFFIFIAGTKTGLETTEEIKIVTRISFIFALATFLITL